VLEDRANAKFIVTRRASFFDGVFWSGESGLISATRDWQGRRESRRIRRLSGGPVRASMRGAVVVAD